jgi:hypothetical protein
VHRKEHSHMINLISGPSKYYANVASHLDLFLVFPCVLTLFT